MFNIYPVEQRCQRVYIATPGTIRRSVITNLDFLAGHLQPHPLSSWRTEFIQKKKEKIKKSIFVSPLGQIKIQSVKRVFFPFAASVRGFRIITDGKKYRLVAVTAQKKKKLNNTGYIKKYSCKLQNKKNHLPFWLIFKNFSKQVISLNYYFNST